MRSTPPLIMIAATSIAAFTFAAAILLSADLAIADDKKSGESACTCPEKSVRPSTRPKFAELKHTLDEGDEIAALESVQFALGEIGDGATYVWHRHNGRISGVVHPTSSFKDASGNVCRHLVVMLTSGPSSRKAEGIACRLASGIWQLDN